MIHTYMEYFIGLDIGTTAVKGILISITGEQIAQAKVTTGFIFPKNRYIEYDPHMHYKAVCNIMQKLSALVPNPSDIKAVSMVAASGNTLLLDKDNKPLTNIISWMDERAVGMLPEGIDIGGVHNVIGWPWTNGLFPMAHLNWFKEKEPELYRKASRICMDNDWINYRLTGEWKLDTSTATTFYLQNQVKKRWYKPYLGALQIKEESLSTIGLPGETAGTITDQASRETGLSKRTLVVLGTFDHPGAARGTGFTKPGDLLLSCGTSWVGFYPLKNRNLGISQHLLVDPFLSPEGPWGTMFSLTHIDLLVNWFLDRFIVSEYGFKINKYKLFDDLAAKAPPGAGGCFIDPYINAKDISASKKILNILTDKYKIFSPSNIARALMEMVVFRLRKNVEQLAKAGIKAKKIAMVGGPSESPIWPQITADITGLKLNLINGQTAGAVGAAMLAARGAGFFKDESEAFHAMGGRATIIEPSVSLSKEYNVLYDEYIRRYEAGEEIV